MTVLDRHQHMTGLADVARRATIDEALLALCYAVTSKRGYLANAGHVIRGREDAATLAADASLPGAGVRLADIVLAHLGLSLETVVDTTPVHRNSALACLIFRLGLLSRMLDMAHAHLEPRVSFGQKTLKHQIVKDGFARACATVLTLQDKCLLRLETGRYDGLADDHRDLTRAEIQAEKLMGGHGYLIDGTHAISYLSMLLASLHGGNT